MRTEFIRRGRCGMAGLAMGAVLLLWTVPASADKLQIGVGPNGAFVTIDEHGRPHGHKAYAGHKEYKDYKEYKEHNRHKEHKEHKKHSYDHDGYDGYGSGHGADYGHHPVHSRHGFHFDGWSPAGHVRQAYKHGNRCIPVQRRDYWRGKPAVLGATACTNRYGRPYIVPHSVHLEHFIYRHGHYHGGKYCAVRH